MSVAQSYTHKKSCNFRKRERDVREKKVKTDIRVPVYNHDSPLPLSNVEWEQLKQGPTSLSCLNTLSSPWLCTNHMVQFLLCSTKVGVCSDDQNCCGPNPRCPAQSLALPWETKWQKFVAIRATSIWDLLCRYWIRRIFRPIDHIEWHVSSIGINRLAYHLPIKSHYLNTKIVSHVLCEFRR